MDEFNEVTTVEEVNEVSEVNTTEEAGFNPIVIGVGLGALAILGGNLILNRVIKPAIQRHKDKKAAPDVVNTADYADAKDCSVDSESDEK
jgi:hypothetical protein